MSTLQSHSPQSHSTNNERLRLLAPLDLVLDRTQRGCTIEFVVLVDLGPVRRTGKFLVRKRDSATLHILDKVVPDILRCRRLGSRIGGEEDFDDDDVLDFCSNSVATVGF